MPATYIVALVHIQVCLHVALVCSPDSACHTRPWLLERKHALDVVSVDLFAGYGVNDGRLDAKERQRGGSGLCGCYTTKRSDDMGASLRLPVGLDILACQ
jgi:hypothetical protein